MKTITILARKWFDKISGNSYFSARIYVDNKYITSLPFQYGYERQYIVNAKEKLNVLGLIKSNKNQLLWQYCENNNIRLLTDKANLKTKKEVKSFVS